MGRQKKYKTEKERIKANKDRSSKYYLDNKDEVLIQQKIHYDNNKETILDKQKIYYTNNRDEILKYANEYIKLNKNKIKEYKDKYCKNNKNIIADGNKKYYNKNRLIIRKKQYKYKVNRLKTDNLFKLNGQLCKTIRNSFKNKGFKKNIKTIEILGCSYIEFREHMEQQFQSWMSWDNYGNPKDGIFELNKTWDIDHIIPLSTATTEEELIKLMHYSNTRPLCSYYNRWIKGNNLIL